MKIHIVRPGLLICIVLSLGGEETCLCINKILSFLRPDKFAMNFTQARNCLRIDIQSTPFLFLMVNIRL